jgi:head-tail adaptor
MARCQKLRRKKRTVCAGDLDTLIDIQCRALDDGFDDPEETESFTTVDSPWAMVETLRGVFVVDSVNGGDIEATHRFTIRFPDTVTTGENWVLANNKRYRILDQQNFEERNEWLQILCTERGAVGMEAADA